MLFISMLLHVLVCTMLTGGIYVDCRVRTPERSHDSQVSQASQCMTCRMLHGIGQGPKANVRPASMPAK